MTFLFYSSVLLFQLMFRRSSPPMPWDKTSASVCKTKEREKSERNLYPSEILVWCSLFSEISQASDDQITQAFCDGQPATGTVSAADLSVWGRTCLWPKWKPRYLTSTHPVVHFFGISLSPSLCTDLRTALKCWRCCWKPLIMLFEDVAQSQPGLIGSDV